MLNNFSQNNTILNIFNSSNPITVFYNTINMLYNSFSFLPFIFQILSTIIFILFLIIIGHIYFYYLTKLINSLIVKKFMSERIKTFMLNNNHNPHVKYLQIFYNYIINNLQDWLLIVLFFLFIGPMGFIITCILINNISFEEYLKFSIKYMLLSFISNMPFGFFVLLYVFYSSINKKIKIQE